ncbi:MAG: 30S ribosomal protein S20 [bacterium]|nr:30S ribosomal protein S20 [bacterium]
MANIASQIKRNRQTIVRHERNKAVRSELKTRIRNAIVAAESGDRAAATEQLRLAQRYIDKATTKGLLHKKTAGRRKARLTKQVNDLLG